LEKKRSTALSVSFENGEVERNVDPEWGEGLPHLRPAVGCDEDVDVDVDGDAGLSVVGEGKGAPDCVRDLGGFELPVDRDDLLGKCGL
jgi:hypothetical protein